MLKPSHKKIQNTDIKKDGKINAHEQLKQNQYDQYIFTQPAWALAWALVHVLILVLN